MSGNPRGQRPDNPDSNNVLLVRVTALVELKRRLNEQELTPMGDCAANARFWEKMRSILLVNGASVGAARPDDVAIAVIQDKPDAAESFNSVVTLISKPLSPPGSSSTSRTTSFSAQVPYMLVPKDPPLRQLPTLTILLLSNTFVTFVVSPQAPPVAKSDLKRLYKTVHDCGLPVERIQYPWEGQRLFNDPTTFSGLYLAHWRTRMAIGYAAFEWGLHASLPDNATQEQRRKRNMGGGQLGKNNSDKKYKGPTISDLGVLLRSDKEAYLKKTQSASKLFKLDQDGFTDLPSMLAFRTRWTPIHAPSVRLIPPFDPTEAGKANLSVFKRADYSSTALPPVTPTTPWANGYGPRLSTDEEESEEDEVD
ncbi:hypothetical protein GQ600_6544 [Phytophthora cactorum]|nr:hypothetical protein GQ600_6544 [Phytophthora cactorum]